MRLLGVLLSLLLVGCNTANIFRSGNDDMCRYMSEGIGARLDEAITSELRKKAPQGAISQGYSREAWDSYWNNRIYYVWNIGPESCNGTYKGPSGPEMIRRVLARRQEIGLPAVNLEERNRDKSL